MQEIINVRTYAEFVREVIENVKKTAVDAKALAEDFIVTGYLLREAEETNILRDSECKTMGEFAAKYYGIDKSTASRFIHINQRYSVGGNSRQLDDRYSNFGYTKLAEMLTLPDAIVEEISPELTRNEIRTIKEEVAEEKKISDIEVMLEQKDAGVEAEGTLLGKIIYQIGHEHSDIFEKLWMAVNVKNAEINALNEELAPSGIVTISCRIPGTGRYMLSIDEDEKIKTIFLRDNSKEEFTWEELQQVAVALLKTDASNWKETYQNIYNKEISEEKVQVAPAQPKTERVVKAKPEKTKKTPKKEEKKAELVAVQEEHIPGKMEVADHTELLPEGEKDGIHKTTDDDRRPSDSGDTGCNEEERGTGTESGTPSNESETAQSDGESSTEKSRKDSPKTVAEIFRSIRTAEEAAISENEAIRRKFAVFSRGKMPIGELEVLKEHAEKLLEAINEAIKLKTNAKDGK